jgi:hypothetical protein
MITFNLERERQVRDEKYQKNPYKIFFKFFKIYNGSA